MTLYTPLAPNGLSPCVSSQIRQLSSRLDAPWGDEPNTEFVRLTMNLGTTNRHVGRPAPLPGLHHLLDSKRLPPLTAPNWTSVASSDPSFYCHSLHQKSARYPVNPRSLLSSISPPVVDPRCHHHPGLDIHTAGLESPDSLYRKADNVLRALDHAPFVSPTPSPPSLNVHQAYAHRPMEVPRRSKAAIATDDWDHPSFARPPHRPIDPKPKAVETHHIHGISGLEASHCSVQCGDNPPPKSAEPESLVPNSYPVPPPPPYEQSAAPIADLAVEIVWDRCFPARPRPSVTSPIMPDLSWRQCLPKNSSPQASSPTDRHSATSDWIRPTNLFGVIGSEVKARKFYRVCAVNAGNSLPPTEFKRPYSGVETEVKPAFRRWARQVLEQTLLSPQVLVLALYYIDSVVGIDVFGDFNGKMSLMPYKMFLAGLVLANKTLDDHSYKNSTFANVSSMTTTEVNTIEVALLRALKFNVVPNSEQWSRWVQELVSHGRRSGFKLDESDFFQSDPCAHQFCHNVPFSHEAQEFILYGRRSGCKPHDSEFIQSGARTPQSCRNIVNEPTNSHSHCPAKSIWDYEIAAPIQLASQDPRTGAAWCHTDDRIQSDYLSQVVPSQPSHERFQHAPSTAQLYRDQLMALEIDASLNRELNRGQQPAYPFFSQQL